MQPLFIVFEGADGAGTTTQCQHLCARLRLEGHCLVETREPGGTEAGERIRKLVLDPTLCSLDDVAELLLYGASRRQHVAEVIEPALRSGKPVISDRYAQSSVAYQGVARGLGTDLVRRVNDLATGGLAADYTIYLDLKVELALERRRKRDGDRQDRLEQAGLDFQASVRDAYVSLSRKDEGNSLLVDADARIEDLAKHVHSTLMARFPHFPYKTLDI